MFYFPKVNLIFMYIVMLIEQEIPLIAAPQQVICCFPWAISNLLVFQETKHMVSRSPIEAEYRSSAQTTVELYWIRQLLCDLHIFLLKPPILWCDNASALALTRNLIFHARSKHIEIDYHFIREKVVRGDLQVQHITFSPQVADLFTKPLPTALFQQFLVKLLKLPSSV